MSETPRLSRKELRELGKLTTRESDSPSLSETAELRLRRPSRKELREAERSNATAEKAILKEFTAHKVAVENAKHSDDSAVESPSSHAMEAVAHEDVKVAQELTPSPTDRVAIKRARGAHSAPSAVSAASAISAESAAQVSNSVADERPKQVATSDQPIRTSVFNRFDNDEEPKQPRSLRERLLERTRRDSEILPSAEARIDEPVTSYTFADEHDDESAKNVVVAEDTKLPAAEENVAKDASVVANETSAIESDVATPESDAVVEPDQSQKAVVTDAVEEESLVYEESGKRNWIGLILLIAIGALVGYLVGSWVSASWLSLGADSHVIAVGTTVFQL